MQIDLSSEEKVSFLISVSKSMGLSVDEVLALYLLLEDKVFFLFDLFQGKSVKFPSMRSLHKGLSSVNKTSIIKLKHLQYMVNGVESYRENIVSGDVVCVDDVEVEALGSPLVFLGGFYLLVTNLSGGENGK